MIRPVRVQHSTRGTIPGEMPELMRQRHKALLIIIWCTKSCHLQVRLWYNGHCIKFLLGFAMTGIPTWYNGVRRLVESFRGIVGQLRTRYSRSNMLYFSNSSVSLVSELTISCQRDIGQNPSRTISTASLWGGLYPITVSKYPIRPQQDGCRISQV